MRCKVGKKNINDICMLGHAASNNEEGVRKHACKAVREKLRQVAAALICVPDNTAPVFWSIFTLGFVCRHKHATLASFVHHGPTGKETTML